jgi:UDP-glucuronate decarboxylase
MKQRILVTGGAGFIGSHLCRRLLADGYEVYCLDNLFTGDKRNIQDLRSDPHFKLVIHDIIDPYFLDSVDGIFNLACPASPPHYQFNAIRTIKANTIGMINMLGLAKKHKVRILQASTSEVYGDPEQHPQRESYRGNVSPIGIRACYDEGKRVAEALCFDYHRQNNVDIRVVRIFNTYGPNMRPDDGRVVSNFIVQALRGDDITLYGDGTQTRSFCYVSDLVEGLVRMFRGERFTGPVNLGNPGEFTILELAEAVIRLTGSASRIVYRPLPQDDPTRRKPDISLADEKLGWKPAVPLEDGLGRTIAYFRKAIRE